jgi:hypothetical protein
VYILSLKIKNLKYRIYVNQIQLKIEIKLNRIYVNQIQLKIEIKLNNMKLEKSLIYYKFGTSDTLLIWIIKTSTLEEIKTMIIYQLCLKWVFTDELEQNWLSLYLPRRVSFVSFWTWDRSLRNRRTKEIGKSKITENRIPPILSFVLKSQLTNLNCIIDFN